MTHNQAVPKSMLVVEREMTNGDPDIPPGNPSEIPPEQALPDIPPGGTVEEPNVVPELPPAPPIEVPPVVPYTSTPKLR